MKLAADCPNLDKAFSVSTRGKVLGIVFDTNSLSWSLPSEKRIEYMNIIHSILESDSLSLFMAESLLGKLNFVTALAPLMCTFKANLQAALAELLDSNQGALPLAAELKADLLTWWAFLDISEVGFPIPHPRCHPPLGHLVLTTDAAGWSRSASNFIDAGMGAVLLNENGELSFANQSLWNLPSHSPLLDSSGKHLGNKTTSLELAGVAIPLLLLANQFSGKHVVVQVDNIACHHIVKKGYSSADRLASVLARLICLLQSKFSFALHVVHHPRMSSWERIMADRLSRARSTSESDRRLLSSFPKLHCCQAFSDWMLNPIEDWSKPMCAIDEL